MSAIRTTLGGVSWDGGARIVVAPPTADSETVESRPPDTLPDLLPHLRFELQGARSLATRLIDRADALAEVVEVTADLEAALGRRATISDVLSGDEEQQARRRALLLRAIPPKEDE